MAKELTKTVIEKRRNAAPPSDEIKHLAIVIRDASLIPDARLFENGDPLCAERLRFTDAARTEYLRRFPRCLDLPKGPTMIVQYVDSWLQIEQTTYGRARNVRKIEWHLACLFCRESLATLPEGSRMLPNSWWDPLHLHTLGCAATFVLFNDPSYTRHWPKPKAWQLAKNDPKKKRKTP